MRLSWELSRCCWSADAPTNEAEAEVEEGGGAVNADMLLLLLDALSSSRRGSDEAAIDGDIFLSLDDEGCEAEVVEEAPACTP